jgi:long-chain acyl-CoA synthetase
MEGYGMTETSPVISVNYLGHVKFGTVGPILKNIEVKIAEDGEILMRGPSQMLGYYKDPEKTKETIDKDGWLHTGDIGELDEDGFLKITDRKKEIFKLSTGKYVAPQLVENRFKESPFIDQLMVVGEGEKYAAAIISPDFAVLHKWAANNNITYKDNVELIEHPKVIERIQKEVDRINKTLGRHRQIKKFALTCKPWTTETGELSPTLKLKRKHLKKVYKKKLDYLYGYSDDPGHLVIKSKE